jgi:hypothetical protein
MRPEGLGNLIKNLVVPGIEPGTTRPQSGQSMPSLKLFHYEPF